MCIDYSNINSKRKIGHGRGPSNMKLAIFVCYFDMHNRGGSSGGVEGVATPPPPPHPFENFFFVICLILRKTIIE